MKEGLSPGPTFQQGGNNTRKVGNNGLIVLWPASRDTENIRYGLWALPRVSPHAVTHLWWLGRQRPPLYPRGSLPDRWTCPDRWLTPSLSSAGSRPSRIWSRTWWQRRAVTASQERARADFIKPGKKKINNGFVRIKNARSDKANAINKQRKPDQGLRQLAWCFIDGSF